MQQVASVAGYLLRRYCLSAWLLLAGVAHAADTSILDGMRAIHMGGNWGATYSHQQYLDETKRQGYINWLKSIDANWVGISVALYVDNSMDSQVKRKYQPEAGTLIPTFTDAELTAMVQALHANGIKVYVTLAFENTTVDQVDDPVKYVNRGMFGIPDAWQWSENPPQEHWPWDPTHPDHATFVAEFWQSYTDQAVYFASLAESLGVEMFSLGTETDGLFRTRTDTNWPDHFKDELLAMVSAVRGVYTGLLTYDQFYATISLDLPAYGDSRRWLWQDLGLDVIGLSAYFELTDALPSSRVSYSDLKSAYEAVFTDYLLRVQADHPDLPIVFTEYGYTDSIGAPHVSNYQEQMARVFLDDDGTGVDDGIETQADIYTAFFETNRENGGLVRGAFLWGHDWTDDTLWDSTWGWARHIGVRGKLAEQVVRTEFSQIAGKTGTLVGTVVSASNGEPVYPVAIDLLDPVTGEFVPGLDTGNNPDGSFSLGNIPSGNYKIQFNPYAAAAGFGDELYDSVPCDDLSCDRAALGDVISISGGLNELNVDLERRLTLWGRVTDEGGAPIGGALIEVFDESGFQVGGLVGSQADGGWAKTLPGPGSYYARVASDSVPGYQPEVWNDVPCNACDVITAGTPIVVGSEDVADINFQLDPLFAISGRVTTEAGTPLVGVPVDVIDGAGELVVGGAAFTDGNGYWLRGVPAPGNYYARTVGSWTPAYQAEIWNDHACDDCYTDLLSIGDPIEVTNGHVTGVDFALAAKPLPEPLDPCEQVRRQFRAYHLAGPDDPKFQAIRNRSIPPSFIAGLKALNVNWVGIMQKMYVDDALDSSLEYEPKGQDAYNLNWSFTDEDLEFLIRTFQGHGINVYVTLAIGTSLTLDSDHPVKRHEMGAQSHSLGPVEAWPWNVDHPDHERFVAEFWQTYRDRAVELAEILERNGVTLYSIGTETRNLFRTRIALDEGHPNSFDTELQTIVSDVRQVYSGLLSYDMHWGEFAYPSPAWGSLWDDLGLDIIGISAYIDNVLPEIPAEVPDVPTLEASFDNIFRTQFLPVQQANSGRPVLFLEGSFSNSIGAPYVSHHNLGGTDTDEDGNGMNDGEETQANLFRALFNVTNRYRTAVKGLFVWDRFMVSDEAWQDIMKDDPIILGTRGLLADEVVREIYGAWKAEEESRIFDSSFERCILERGN